MFYDSGGRKALLPLIYANAGDAALFLIARLIWIVPEIIGSFKQTAGMRWSQQAAPLYAYLFWGAEYWVLRQQHADSSYLQAFARILEHA